MRGSALLLALLLAGCPPADPHPPGPGDAPSLVGEAPSPAPEALAPPAPTLRVEKPPPPLPSAPPAPAPDAPLLCPEGMTALRGGAATLGESSGLILAKHTPNTVVPRGRWAIAPFCIDTFPLPGRAGDPWPTDGLNKVQIREQIEPWLWSQGRRLCTVAELMFAAGGSEGLRYPWGDEPRAGVCDPKDEAPDPMGSVATCVSSTGVREFQVRSTWARLDATTLAALTDAGGHTQPGFDGGYTVWGGLVRDDTYYAPTNAGVHFHQDDAPAFNDDGLRTCAWPAAVEPAHEASWAAAMEALRKRRTLRGLAP